MISKGQQLKKNILVEEREFMRMERKLKKIGPQGGRGWGTAMISKGQQLKKKFWWRNVNLCEWNVNLCEWNVTAKLMSTYKNR